MATTEDGFLGGQLTIRQPSVGYRAGVDPVLLAASVPARAGDHVLDLGCGVGVAALCLAARVPGVVLHGVELQADYAALALENATTNQIAFEVTEGDITNLPPVLRALDFDQVIANPPYFQPSQGTSASDAGRAMAFAETAPLAAWVDTGLRRLRPRGRLTMIQRIERLPEILTALGDRAGDIWVMPIAGRLARAPDRALVTALKSARGPFRMTAPLVLHDGASHGEDGEDYTPPIRQVLRHAAPLEWAFR